MYTLPAEAEQGNALPCFSFQTLKTCLLCDLFSAMLSFIGGFTI